MQLFKQLKTFPPNYQKGENTIITEGQMGMNLKLLIKVNFKLETGIQFFKSVFTDEINLAFFIFLFLE